MCLAKLASEGISFHGNSVFLDVWQGSDSEYGTYFTDSIQCWHGLVGTNSSGPWLIIYSPFFLLDGLPVLVLMTIMRPFLSNQ